jgi:hypothetical protein
MADTVKHKFVNQKADGPDVSVQRPSDWNAEHAFAGGEDGAILVRDSGESDGAAWQALADLLALEPSLPVVTDGESKPASLAYTGGTSLRKNLGLETSDTPTFAGLGGTPLALRGHLFGLSLSNNGTDPTNDIDVAAGEAVSDDLVAADRINIILGAGLTKRSDVAWAVGSGNGWLDTGSIGNGTYHVFLIERVDTGVVDSLLSLSATAPSMPANYTKKRRIGSIKREAGSIVLFTQTGDCFRRSVAMQEFSTINPGTNGITVTLAYIPTGIIVEAEVTANLVMVTGAGYFYLSPLAASDQPLVANTSLGQIAAYGPTGTVGLGASGVRVLTNTSAQIRCRIGPNSDGNTVIKLASLGWYDRRGRDA